MRKAGSFKVFFSIWNILFGGLIICSSLWLKGNGLSSRERLQFSLGGAEAVEKIFSITEAFNKRKNILRSEFLAKTDRRHFIELARFSPYFNTIRSINSKVIAPRIILYKNKNNI
jgi:hypothetical protein